MRRLLTLATAFALLGVAPGSAASDGNAERAREALAAMVTTQLPRSVRPSHYAIEITPQAEALRFDGRVSIDIEVLEPVDRIVLQAAGMTFSNSALTDSRGRSRSARVSVDAVRQNATFLFRKKLKPGRHILTTRYVGTIGTQANGLFAIDYPTPEGRKRALFTQFENSDARRFVPSWDEPFHKATFDLAVTTSGGEMVVSNMPVATEDVLADGSRRVVFQRSPKMSTYLLFLAVGEFDRIAMGNDAGTEIGVIAQKGKVEQALYALDATGDILREYNDYFGVPYPLPKLDNIAAPGRSQFFSAMENWGAIFTFEHSFLLDPAVANMSDRQRVFSITAHEIAHQWFGNLVTMAWWDDLWLNEGFATWIAGRTTRKLHPEWDASATRPAFSSRAAMEQDAYVTTHPVVQHVETVEQASQAFDGITYGKGAAVIAMLEDYVGEDAWRGGVRSYIGRHAYGNAVTDDLWQAMEQAAPGKQFLAVAHDFTRQSGIPLLRSSSACVEGRTVVNLEQGEFTLDRPEKTPLRWRVPVAVRVGDADPMRVLVDGKARVELPGCDAPARVNAGQKGYFRTLYAPEQFKSLVAGMAALPAVDQLGIMMDASALASAGLQPEADALNLAMQVPLDAVPELWQMVAATLEDVDALLEGNAERQNAFRAMARKHLGVKFQTLGWELSDEDDAALRRLRTDLVRTLGRFGDAAVLTEARRRYEASATEPAALPAELRRTVLEVVAHSADAATWEQILRSARSETSALLRDQYYGLLASTADAVLAQRALDMALTDEPGATNAAAMISGVSFEHPDLAFDFAVAHREQVDPLVDSTSRARYYPRLGSGSSRLDTADKIRAFAQAHIAPTSRRDADSAVAAIQTRLRLRQARLPQIEAWLTQQGL